MSGIIFPLITFEASYSSIFIHEFWVSACRDHIHLFDVVDLDKYVCHLFSFLLLVLMFLSFPNRKNIHVKLVERAEIF